MYSASFYDFNTQEEKWAFWAKMIKLNRFNEEPLKLYQELLSLVKNKTYNNKELEYLLSKWYFKIKIGV